MFITRFNCYNVTSEVEDLSLQACSVQSPQTTSSWVLLLGPKAPSKDSMHDHVLEAIRAIIHAWACMIRRAGSGFEVRDSGLDLYCSTLLNAARDARLQSYTFACPHNYVLDKLRTHIAFGLRSHPCLQLGAFAVCEMEPRSLMGHWTAGITSRHWLHLDRPITL